jgi:hypothetical protein
MRKKYPVETECILKEFNQSISSRLKKKVTHRQSLLTDACKAYHEATGEHPDRTTWSRPRTEQIVTQDESNDLLKVLREAAEQWMTDKPHTDRTIVKSIYEAYEFVILKDGFKACTLRQTVIFAGSFAPR